jgi:DNA-binding transcriptional MerR regulator
MIKRHYQMVLCRNEREELTLEAVASSVGLHPDVVERFVDCGLIDPVGWIGSELLFDATAVPRLQTIKRLRGEIGVNLAGIAVILDLLDRLRALQSRNEWLRGKL